MNKITIGAIRTTEVGRNDYSTNIDRSVIPVGRATRHQSRELGTLPDTSLPTLVYPNYYLTVVGTYDAADNATWHIPYDVNKYLTEVSVHGDTTATTIAVVGIYNNYDVATDTPSDLYAMLALKLAPKIVDLHFTLGIPLRPYAGKYLGLGFAHYSVNPNATLTLYVGLFDDVLVTKIVTGVGVI